MTQEIQTGALYQPRRVGWGGRWDGGSKGRGYMLYLSLSHVEVWQKTTKFCKAIILQLKNKFIKKKEKVKKKSHQWLYSYQIPSLGSSQLHWLIRKWRHFLLLNPFWHGFFFLTPMVQNFSIWFLLSLSFNTFFPSVCLQYFTCNNFPRFCLWFSEVHDFQYVWGTPRILSFPLFALDMLKLPHKCTHLTS